MVFQRERRRKRADPFVLSFSLFFSTVPTRPKVTPLHGGGLDLEEVQKKLLEEFARAARESPSSSLLLLLLLPSLSSSSSSSSRHSYPS